jgi:hypothetical protein
MKSSPSIILPPKLYIPNSTIELSNKAADLFLKDNLFPALKKHGFTWKRAEPLQPYKVFRGVAVAAVVEGLQFPESWNAEPFQFDTEEMLKVNAATDVNLSEVRVNRLADPGAVAQVTFRATWQVNQEVLNFESLAVELRDQIFWPRYPLFYGYAIHNVKNCQEYEQEAVMIWHPRKGWIVRSISGDIGNQFKFVYPTLAPN